jgi:hypothetical protein
MKSSSGFVAGMLLLVAGTACAQQSQQSTSSTSGTSTTGTSTTATSTTATQPAPTLSDLAKAAQDKKGTAPAKKTFTNDDLKDMTPPSSDATTGADGKDTKGTAKSGDTAKSDAAKADDPAKADPAKTEKYWRDRMDGAREDVRRNEAFAAALQSRINGLTADFSARDDPAQRAQIADDRQKALAELDRVNKAIQDGNKTIADIEEEARKAMVPAGWIR